MPRKRTPELSLQERVIAEGMSRGIGNVAIGGTIDTSGVRRHAVGFNDSNFFSLARQFEKDPKRSLAYARENLLAVAHDETVGPEERSSRLDRYYDAYVDLTIRLDHAAFPPTPHGEVRSGIPEYIPDGFVDLGGNKNTDHILRSREQILVDKQEILEKYAPTPGMSKLGVGRLLLQDD